MVSLYYLTKYYDDVFVLKQVKKDFYKVMLNHEDVERIVKEGIGTFYLNSNVSSFLYVGNLNETRESKVRVKIKEIPYEKFDVREINPEAVYIETYDLERITNYVGKNGLLLYTPFLFTERRDSVIEIKPKKFFLF